MAVVTCSNCGVKNRVEEKGATRLRPVCGKCGAALDTSGAPDTRKPRIVTDGTFEREVLATRGIPVLVDCWADWCGPCRMVAPVLDQLAAESGGRYLITKLNVDENPRTAAKFNIRSIPTMLVFKDGGLVDTIVGAQPKHAILSRLT